jgi:hypothetical protein
VAEAIRKRLGAGVGMLSIARQLRVGSSTVQRIKREMAYLVHLAGCCDAVRGA